MHHQPDLWKRSACQNGEIAVIKLVNIPGKGGVRWGEISLSSVKNNNNNDDNNTTSSMWTCYTRPESWSLQDRIFSQSYQKQQVSRGSRGTYKQLSYTLWEPSPAQPELDSFCPGLIWQLPHSWHSPPLSATRSPQTGKYRNQQHRVGRNKQEKRKQK